MRSKINAALIVSLSAIALLLVTSETFAASRTARGAFASAHRPGTHFFRHNRRSQAALGWLGDDGVYYGPNGEELTPPTSGGVRYTDTYDIPWDWAHRYPPAVAPTGRPYVSSCGAETVTVPDGRGGNGQVNIVRCY
ncbi:MAG: hypothetical protein WBG16_14780 [Bradyrhizobium sp.]|jgi:hypothetical protein|uniref:hypothetical protein n=1 Tax=Bradyrhizobium sp. TaxID=376 RepID=UPI003BB00C46